MLTRDKPDIFWGGSIHLGACSGCYLQMRKQKRVRLECLGIGLGFNFELVFDVMKSRKQLALQVGSLGQMSGPRQRSGCSIFRHDRSHCGGPRVSPQAENMR